MEKQHLRCNKSQDPEFVEFVGAMHDSRVPQHCTIDFILDMHDGPKNIPITTQNLKACKYYVLVCLYVTNKYINMCDSRFC